MLSRKYSSYIIIPALFIAAFSSCKKSELQAFDQTGMVHFYKKFDNPHKDSVQYSFAIKPDALMEDTVKLPVRIAGVAADKDRTIALKAVADSTNAVEGVDYKIYSAIIRAGNYNDSVVLLVYRKPEMKTVNKRLLLEIIPSADLLPGLTNTASGTLLTGGSVRLLVKINDYLTQPANWSMLSAFFGAFSVAKYKFIIQVTGLAEFTYGVSGGIPYAQMTAYQGMLRQALSDYNNEHGTLMDENGQPVTF